MLDNIRERIAQSIRFGDKAREELPLVKEELESEQEAIVRGICALVDKGAPDRKLWVAACELRAVRRIAEKLVGGIVSAKIARQEAQDITREQGG